ncbi:MAG TPA: hypothetical protein VGI40_03525 [Pirellulaceae bacterium]|jgi:hypothetical protein
MTTYCIHQQRISRDELAQVIEPLANMICAADRPREALLSALNVLFDEVEGTHKASLMHVACRRVDSLGLAL